MNKDKQIEEMARDLCKNISCAVEEWAECSLHRTDAFCARCKGLAERLYNADYRKASEVAREIFAEIEKCLLDKDSPLTVWCAINGQKYAELKKKYIGEDTNVLTNTEDGE